MIERLPVTKHLIRLDNTEVRNFNLAKGLSAETSGGLLICMEKDKADDFVREMHDKGHDATIVGRVEKASGKNSRTSRIVEKVEVVEI